MKQIIFILLSLTFSFFLKAQSIQIDSCGLDNSSSFTHWEIDYFQVSIPVLKTMEMENKKFAFAYGNDGKTIMGKKDYFDNWGKPYHKKNATISCFVIQLSAEEKLLSGGYDVILVLWSKTTITGKNRKN